MGQRWKSMIVVLAVFVAATDANQAFAAKILWQKDLASAIKLSKQTKKPILLEGTATWCSYCQKMLRYTFTDQTLVRHINQCFIPVTIDADENEELLEKLGIEALPTTVIISHDLKVLKRMIGFKNAAEMGKQLSTICSPKAKRTATKKRPPQIAEALFDSRFAFKQICLTSLLDDAKLEHGTDRHAIDYKGRRICFASAEYKDRFQQNPAKYWPVLDGICPVNAIDERVRKLGDPEMAVIFRGRVWFCSDEETREEFAENPKDYSRQPVKLLPPIAADDKPRNRTLR